MTELLREAIRQSGLSLNQLGKDTGIGASPLSRFMRRERGLHSDAIDRLCQALRLTLVRLIATDAVDVPGEQE